MAVTLEWIRDNYDNNPKNRYIDNAEVSMASFDESRRTITKEQLDAVVNAWENHVLLPEYTSTINEVDGYHTVQIHIPTGATLEVDGVEVI